MTVDVVDGVVMLEGAPLRGGISADGFAVIHLHRDGWLTAGYLRDAAGVWWFHERTGKAVRLSDSTQFRVLDDDYGLSATTVYLEDTPIPGADPATFELLEHSPYFARDRRRIYVKGGKRFCHFDKADAATAVANGAYLADKDHLYHHYSAITLADDQKDTAEAQDGTRLRDWLHRHHPGIVGWWHPEYIAPPAEPEAELLTRDGARIFYNGYPVDGADPATFEMVSERFGKDAHRVYRRDFTRTSWPFGHPDDVLVAVEKSDPATFEVFSTAWARDATTVYLWGAPKKKLDPASFRFLGNTPTNSWACDDHGLYRSNGTLRVAGVNGATFRRLDDDWGTDGQVVFCLRTGAVTRAADAASFRLVNGGAEDDHATYRITGGSVRRVRK
ncbi:DKNYY domain-containing protein [Mycolicibacterium tokaiense]|uniref:DKNYY domain-containing protein n=1 Tax=Mycolicibacterium tokaiense TaxID=39695 RepID=UPI0011C07605|nr:DKNYY domain-containing protein [Mycolicibacterium tokaiense]